MNLKNILRIIFFTIIIILMQYSQVLALTDLQMRAADLNWDGEVDEHDLALLLSIGYPDAPKDGIASPNGKYFSLSSTTKDSSSASGSYIGLAFTQLHENGPMWLYCFGKEECCKNDYIKRFLTDYNSSVYINNYIDEAKQYYYPRGDSTSNGSINYGYGVLVYLGGKYYNVENFAKYGVDLKAYVQSNKNMEVEYADNVSKDVWLVWRKWITDRIESLGYDISDFEDYQIDCMTDIAYQGLSGKIASIAKAYINSNKQCTSAVRAAAGSAMSSGTSRGEDRWNLFSKGIYQWSDGGSTIYYVLNPDDFGSYGDAATSDLQNKIVEVATNSLAYGIVPVSGMCLGWVQDVYAKAGVQNIVYYNCARCEGYYCGVSNDWDTIPVGAAVFAECGTTYGHVGIYIGNGNVIHNSLGNVKTNTLTDFVNARKPACWGWTTKEPLTGGTYTRGLISKGKGGNC